MFKKILTTATVACALFGMVGLAHAADIEINMFGASAQFNYWSTYTPSFLISPAVGCAKNDVYHAKGTVDSRSNYIGLCHKDTTITVTGGLIGSNLGSKYGDDLIVRYSTYASAPGLQSAIGNLTDPDGCGTSQRKMASILSTFIPASWTGNCAAAPSSGVTATQCVEVKAGCADTGPECFTQSTEGPDMFNTYADIDPPTPGADFWCTQGAPAGSGLTNDWTPGAPHVEAGNWWNVTPPDLTGFDSLTQKSPFVVPFAFMRNNTATHGAALGAIVNGAGDKYMNNLSRAQAGLLFSGNIPVWSMLLEDDDKAGFTDSVMLCIRHAGSGTHATLDWTVMRPFYSLQTYAIHPGDPVAFYGFAPAVMTNKGSSDETACVKSNGGLDDCGSELYAAGGAWAGQTRHTFTAVGYAEYDTLSTTINQTCNNQPTSSDGKAAKMCYTGKEANDQTVQNCGYDFWGAQVCIYHEAENTNNLLANIMDFAGNTGTPANPYCGTHPIPVVKMKCDREDCTKPIRIKP